jgi:hypothetical protein
MTEAHRPGSIWGCKIGVIGARPLPMGCDAPMRNAVRAAFRDVVGEDAEFTFSGWSETLTEPEMAVVENRLPDPAHYAAERLRAAAPGLLEAAVEFVRKVDAGEARSTKSYAAFKAAILKATTPNAGEKG